MILLKIKPDDLQVGFDRDWNDFRNRQSHSFLVVWLHRELRNFTLQLENTSPENLQSVQGQVKFIRRMLELIQRPHNSETVPELVEFLNKLER